MDMPDFQSVMLPLLRLSGDGQEHVMATAIVALADGFDLTPEHRAELLPGGGQRRFNNRVYWAAAHLRAAGLLASPTRGRFRITDAGMEVLKAPPAKLTMGFLQKFPGYAEFKSGGGTGSGSHAAVALPQGPQTPDEVIASAFKSLNEELASDLLTRIVNNPPDFLEKLVLRLLRAIGYGGAMEDAATPLGGSGDDGVDGVVKQDKLGLDLIYVQAKRWNASHPVSSPDIRNFIGSLQIKTAHRGVFITTSSFTSDAKEAATKGGKQIVLIDGSRLAELMIEHGVGVETQQTYVLKTVNTDFFDAD